jgi:hypothetical protein
MINEVSSLAFLKWVSRTVTQDSLITIQDFIILISIDISIKTHQFVLNTVMINMRQLQLIGSVELEFLLVEHRSLSADFLYIL